MKTLVVPGTRIPELVDEWNTRHADILAVIRMIDENIEFSPFVLPYSAAVEEAGQPTPVLIEGTPIDPLRFPVDVSGLREELVVSAVANDQIESGIPTNPQEQALQGLPMHEADAGAPTEHFVTPLLNDPERGEHPQPAIDADEPPLAVAEPAPNANSNPPSYENENDEPAAQHIRQPFPPEQPFAEQQEEFTLEGGGPSEAPQPVTDLLRVWFTDARISGNAEAYVQGRGHKKLNIAGDQLDRLITAVRLLQLVLPVVTLRYCGRSAADVSTIDAALAYAAIVDMCRRVVEFASTAVPEVTLDLGLDDPDELHGEEEAA